LTPSYFQTFEEVLQEALSNSNSLKDGTPIALEDLGADIASRLASAGIDAASEHTDNKVRNRTYFHSNSSFNHFPFRKL
jgi:hypothetical protein